MKWYESPNSDSSAIISARIRLARNVSAYSFPAKLTDAGAEKLISDVGTAMDKANFSSDFLNIHIRSLSQAALRMYMENHVVSPEFLSKNGHKGLLVNKSESVGIMINEEDHIRIQSIFSGDNLYEGLLLANKIDDGIDDSLDYAFDKNFGYLTSCPTNAGTGLRASYMLHLPMLEVTGRIGGIAQAISKFGMTLRGIYGEGSESQGSIYQVSNQLTLGKSEEDILALLKGVTQKIIENENEIRDNMIPSRTSDYADRIFRSYGVLRSAKKLEKSETMRYLSDIRTGYLCGVLDLPKPEKPIYNIMMEIQPGHIAVFANENVDENEAKILRAEIVKKAFGE